MTHKTISKAQRVLIAFASGSFLLQGSTCSQIAAENFTAAFVSGASGWFEDALSHSVGLEEDEHAEEEHGDDHGHDHDEGGSRISL